MILIQPPFMMSLTVMSLILSNFCLAFEHNFILIRGNGEDSLHRRPAPQIAPDQGTTNLAHQPHGNGCTETDAPASSGTGAGE